MILIAEKLEGKYAQIIFSEGDYGESGKNALIVIVLNLNPYCDSFVISIWFTGILKT
jgi:hypothetical protein